MDKTTNSVSFAFDIKVRVPNYELDGTFVKNSYYENAYILRELILIEAFSDKEALGGWLIKYGYQDMSPNKSCRDATTRLLESGTGLAFDIDLLQTARPGLRGPLRIEDRPWN